MSSTHFHHFRLKSTFGYRALRCTLFTLLATVTIPSSQVLLICPHKLREVFRSSILLMRLATPERWSRHPEVLFGAKKSANLDKRGMVTEHDNQKVN